MPFIYRPTLPACHCKVDRCSSYLLIGSDWTPHPLSPFSLCSSTIIPCITYHCTHPIIFHVDYVHLLWNCTSLFHTGGHSGFWLVRASVIYTLPALPCRRHKYDPFSSSSLGNWQWLTVRSVVILGLGVQQLPSFHSFLPSTTSTAPPFLSPQHVFR